MGLAPNLERTLSLGLAPENLTFFSNLIGSQARFINGNVFAN